MYIKIIAYSSRLRPAMTLLSRYKFNLCEMCAQGNLNSFRFDEMQTKQNKINKYNIDS